MLGMTLWAAIASRMEGEVGSLEPSKRADFVFLDRDWLQLADPHDVMSSRVRAVYMEGTRVHSSSLP
jgi:imidazolonepropionase-like amidohydrolase